MKIMFFYSSMMAGGAERMISALANNYVQQEIDVTVAVLDQRPSFYPLDPRIRYMNLYKIVKSTSKMRAIWNGLSLIRVTRQALKRVRPDCVICFGTNYVFYAALARILLDIKVIGSERNNPREGRSFWDKASRLISLAADGYIFQTNGAKEYYPLKVQAKSEVISNGIFIDKNAKVVPFEERLPNSICAVGRLHYQKGYDTLLKAFSIFSKKCPSYTLIIFGEGQERPILEQMIEVLDLKTKVELAGRIPNVLDRISQIQIYVLSSRFEGMPNALLEGLVSGCVCISTACDYGPAELITNGENGLLVPVEDPIALAGAMERLAADTDLCVKLSKNAIKIRDSHSIERIAEEYLNYTQRIID